MAFKTVLLCVSALLVQSIYGQSLCYTPSSSCGCGSSSYGSYGGCGGSGSYGSSLGSLSSSSIAIPSSGGDFLVTSIGPITPSGISVASDIGLAGSLDVCGALPFLSAVSFQDNFDTTGSGSVSYGCGDGCIGINSVIGNSGYSGSGCGIC